MQKRLIGDAAWVVDVSCFRQLIEWADSKESFGNTPENEKQSGFEQAQSGLFPFSGYGATRHFDGYAVISEAGTASKFGVFRAEVCRCRTSGRSHRPLATVTTKLEKQQIKVWAGPLCGPEIAQQSEKAKRHQSGACSDLTAPGFFIAQTALCSE